MLTAQQQRLLEFIHTRTQSSGVSPSFDEMKDALNLKSKSGIHRLIKALEERGFLRRLPNRARALEVIKLPESIGASAKPTKSASVIEADFSKPRTTAQPPSDTHDMVEIPLHGKIAAGTPIEALESTDNYLKIPAEYVSRGECYALEISGDSMIEKGILDGDTIIVERCQTARDGEIVVALVDGEEATLKTLKRSGQHIALIPANRDYETQIYDSNRISVQGRLVGLYRSYRTYH